MDVVRSKLASSQISSPALRWVSTGNKVQQTWDGGSTWVDNPGADPRTNPGGRKPSRTTSDPPCDAAANAVAYLKASVDGFVARAGIASQVTGLLGVLLTFLGGAGIIIEAIIDAVADLELITSAVVDAAMTTAVYTTLECIFKCNFDSHGSCSDTQFATIRSEISSQLPGVPNDVLQVILNFWGAVGLSNAGASGSLVGSCSGCVCLWCYEWSGTQFPLEWTQDNDPNGGLSVFFNAVPSVPFTTVTHVEFTYTYTGAGAAGSAAAIWIPQATRVVLTTPLPTGTHTVTWTGSVASPLGIKFGANGNTGEHINITHLLIRGSGVAPAWLKGNAC